MKFACRERTNFLAINRDEAEYSVFFVQRYLQCGARSPQIDKRAALQVTGPVWLFRCKVNVMNDSLPAQHTVGRGPRTRNNSRFCEMRCVPVRNASQRDGDKAIRFEHIHGAEGGITKVHCLFEHCLEHRRKCARR